MCLSQTVLLHRKLRNAGVEADLNVFEGMWHFFWENPDLPESHEAMAALASFFNRHRDSFLLHYRQAFLCPVQGAFCRRDSSGRTHS